MRLKIGVLLKKLQNWLPKAQAEFEAQAAELEAQVQRQNLAPLAHEQVMTLRQQINSLTTSVCYQQTIKSKLSEAIARWQGELNAPNSLTILGSPIDNFSSIFQAVLAELEKDDYLECKSLSWSNRPPDYANIQAQLKAEIDSFVDDNVEHQPIIIIIPDLSWCFLRCVDGLATIEYLQSLWWTDKSIFWLIGCNTWAWTYLNIISSVEHYLPQTLHLPELNELELKEWLTPVRKAIEFNFAHHQNFNSELNHDHQDDWESASQQNYFEHLAKISLGLAPVASRLWLLSLGTEKENNQSEDENQEDESSDNSKPNIIMQKATLPDLPQLTKDESYLLFSLGLHGQMNLSELAITLGEELIQVQHQVQMLSDSGIIEHHKNICQINPAYYPQLKRHLINNNFLIEEL